MSEKTGAVLVVGGGIGGVQASLDLADSGFKVYMVEKSPSIGGIMAQLDKTFPTNDCSMCILAPKLVTASRHPNIEMITNADIKGLDGEEGNFTVKVLKRARFVDEEKCTGCGLCMEKCPIRIEDQFNHGLNKTKCINIPFPQAVPAVASISKEHCTYLTKGKCGLCQRVCTAGAIDYTQKDLDFEINVGSVILALGFEKFEAELKGEYGYKRYKNVVTSIEFERLLSASGPYGGHVVRPSDHEEPSKLAIVQCVGSRDVQCDSGYCSSVCCTYGTKQAILAREHVKNLDVTIFYMDMRTYGKDFEKYYNRAKNEYGVNYIRSRVSDIKEDKEKNLVIRYYNEDGNIKEDKFDMAVLSIGLKPNKDTIEMAKSLNIELNKYGFASTDEFAPLSTSRKGIYVCGAFQGPKDIPETVTQASGAASKVGADLVESRNTMTTLVQLPDEIDIRGQIPRIGVFVCHCGINIGGVVNCKEVADYAKSLSNVVISEDTLYACSQDAQEKIKERIKEYNLNRVVVASCSPRTHEALFQETMKEVGLNKYLFNMANIRDQCSWVHQNQPQKATEKSKDLVRSSVAKARLLYPLYEQQLPLTRNVLVVGGGVAGMNAALDASKHGYQVALVERQDKLGGIANKIHYTLEGRDVPRYVEGLVKEIEDSKYINLYLSSELEDISGYVGNYKTTINSPKGRVEYEHGVVVVATGAKEYKPREYLYGKCDKVITQMDLEDLIIKDKDFINNVNTVAMIQCVGSRCEERPYCSRICCQEAIKNAILLKEANPNINVVILNRDIRTYSLKEDYYRRARELGVIFVRFEEENPPVVEENGQLTVTFYDQIIKKYIELPVDLVALSVGVVPNEDSKVLAQMLKIPLNEDGFFFEAHAKLRPVDFATAGVFLAGIAHSPKLLSESIVQANAAIGRAATVLTRDYLAAPGVVAKVNRLRCSGCGMCENVCSYQAVRIAEKDNRAEVNVALCQGCGTCASTCKSYAIDLDGFSNQQIMKELEALC